MAKPAGKSKFYQIFTMALTASVLLSPTLTQAAANGPAPIHAVTPQQMSALNNRAPAAFHSNLYIMPAHPITADIRPMAAPELSGPRIGLRGHLPPIEGQSTLLGRHDDSAPMTIEFILPPSNRAELDNLASRLYDPSDSLYQHFLTPAERVARFSPSQAEYDKVAAFAQAEGLAITDTSPDRMMLTASGTVARVENALAVKINDYQRPDGTSFYAPDRDPAVPQSVAPFVDCIVGLTNATAPESDLINIPVQPDSGENAQATGLQPNDIGVFDGIGINAAEIQNAYGLALTSGDGPLNGSGQTVDLVEMSGFSDNDVNGYINYNASNPYLDTNLNPVTLNAFAYGFDGSPSQTTSGYECVEDIEMLLAAADGLSGINVYEENNTGDFVGLLYHILNANDASQVSMSFDQDESQMPQTFENSYDIVTEELAIQGQAVFVSAGDFGAYNSRGGSLNPTVNGLAASPWVTAVGGTSLNLNSGYGYGSEVVWNDQYGATGGGFSKLVGIPFEQSLYLSRISSPNAQASTTKRNIPDVALDADPSTGYNVYAFGGDFLAGGTSLGTPIWAAFWAIANQFRSQYGDGPLGFANQTLYQLGWTGDQANDFHDITSGGNNYFSAGPGYDDTTGLGSFNSIPLLTDLLNAMPASPVVYVSGPSSAQSGQTMPLTVKIDDGMPGGGSATIDLYQILPGGSSVLVGTGGLNSGQSSTTINVVAPDVPGSEYVTYSAEMTMNGTTFGTTGGSQLVTRISPNVVSSVSVSPSVLVGGEIGIGTISLAQPAYQNEMIDLSSSLPSAASVPASVVVDKGQSSATFKVTAKTVTSPVNVTIKGAADPASGLAAGSSQSTTVNVSVLDPVTSLTLSASAVTGGTVLSGTVTLKNPTTGGGEAVTLTSSQPSIAALGTGTLIVPTGESSANFQIFSQAVPAPVTATIKAAFATSSKSATLTINPVAVKSISVKPGTVIGGMTSTVTVTLASTAAAAIPVTLSTSNATVAPVPAAFNIPGGESSASFTIATTSVSAITPVTLGARTAGPKQMTTLTVDPVVALTGLSIAPSTVTGSGTAATGTVTISAATSIATVVSLSSSMTSVASVPASVKIPAGATSAAFSITTKAPTSSTAVMISATLNGVKDQATLTVNP